MPYIYKEVEVEVELDDFETDDLIEELERRQATVVPKPGSLLETIYIKRKSGQDYQRELDELIYSVIGRF